MVLVDGKVLVACPVVVIVVIVVVLHDVEPALDGAIEVGDLGGRALLGRRVALVAHRQLLDLALEKESIILKSLSVCARLTR